jgi:hypothetical protein
MSRIDEEDAAATLALLQLAGQAYHEELAAFETSRVQPDG